ncbi:MAG TPA: hypothetical protein PKE69_03115 [Pyrinomonadaceae bacterium]|nr:hypothetical protein [Pyrinomonadaceae bacterium]
MNREKMFNLVAVFLILIFGFITANAQKSPSINFKTWRITSLEFVYAKDAPNGNSFRLDSSGKLEKRQKDYKITENVEKTNLREIGKLIRQLNLPETKTAMVKGKGIYGETYSHFTIELDEVGYFVEGVSFYDTEYPVFSAEQQKIVEQLKAELKKVGAVRMQKKADATSVNPLNLPIGYSLPLIPAEQKMLFRFEYWKRGDGFQHKGWYMDESGKVYKYSYDLTKTPQNPTSYDLKFKMLPTFFAQAKPEELTKLRELLTKVERGKYTEKEVANDKGTAEINAFLPDSETGKYREIRLASIGDVEGINDAPETEELIVFLKSIVPAEK